jgi:hypothetical protein
MRKFVQFVQFVQFVTKELWPLNRHFLELNAKIRAIRAIRDQRFLTAESLRPKNIMHQAGKPYA